MAEKKSKTVKMNGGEPQGKPQGEKLSYEQLEQIAGNLNHQCQQMQQQIRNMQQALAEVNEIGMLLDILGKSEHFSEAFVNRCSSKIEELVNKAMDAFDEREESDN